MTRDDIAPSLRIVDYVANAGGGVRFVSELVGALLAERELSVTLVSHGRALGAYRERLARHQQLRLVDVPPANRWRGLSGFRGASRVNARLGLPQFHYDVALDACGDHGVLWFPWLHRHRIPAAVAVRSVGSLHDLIMLQFSGLVPEAWREDEHETIRRWLDSCARVAVSSRATAGSLDELFGCGLERTRVIPLSGHHARPPRRQGGTTWPFSTTRYVLCPANTMRHKNHEVLFAGLREAARTHPLVLTGGGTDFWDARGGRGEELRRAAQASGLEWNRSLYGLGHVSDEMYYDVLECAWALVMPTLAEGGGSFPVLEAMASGVPVVVSDIPVMREMMEWSGGDVRWFDPTDPESLATRLQELEQNYPKAKRDALAQREAIRTRTWAAVAADYSRLFDTAVPTTSEPSPS